MLYALFFADNTLVCLQVHVGTLLSGIECFSGKPLQKAQLYETRRGISELKLL